MNPQPTIRSRVLGTKSFQDQLARDIQIPCPPGKIISIVPSQTELLFDLGLDEEIIGVTKFCVHPKEKTKSKTKIGGTKNLNFEKIKSLQPDLIIGNKEENEERQIKELMQHFPVWMSDIKTLDDAYEMMSLIGEIVARKEQAQNLVTEIKSAVTIWQSEKKNKQSEIAYLIWNNPLMTVGSDTFIHHMLGVAGFSNIFSHETRYPIITIEELKERSPQFILLSSEPFPFRQKHADELQKEFPSSKILLVDGEMFSWYGSRLLQAPGYFEKLWREIRGI